MKLHHRLSKLEKALATRGTSEPSAVFDLAAELVRWEDALDAIESLLPKGVGLDPVIEHFQTEMTNISYAARHSAEGDAKATRWFECIRRVPSATVRLFDRLPIDLRVSAASKDAINLGGTSGWSRQWVHDLAWCDSRLPPDITPEVMRPLVVAMAGTKYGLSDRGVVCAACGLRRPRGSTPVPCPYCDEAETMSAATGEAAWRSIAQQELDGDGWRCSASTGV